MSDLVKRLREALRLFDDYLCGEAADEIERKDAAIAELKAALQASLLQERHECDRADGAHAAIAELVDALKSAEIIVREWGDTDWMRAAIAKYDK